MDFNLTSRQRLIMEAVREFMKGECDPNETLELTKKKEFPWRIYKKAGEIIPVLGGRGIAVVSTSRGVLTDLECRQQKIGGEILCHVW